MKNGLRSLITISLLAACGCSYSREIGKVKHLDGSGTTTYRAIHAGGLIRPGVIVVVSQTLGSNAPVVLVQASGPPAAPSLTGAAGLVAQAATFGAALNRGGGDDTTIIVDDERSPMMEPPKMPPNPVVRPPSWPPGHRPFQDRPHKQPPNRGH